MPNQKRQALGYAYQPLDSVPPFDPPPEFGEPLYLDAREAEPSVLPPIPLNQLGPEPFSDAVLFTASADSGHWPARPMLLAFHRGSAVVQARYQTTSVLSSPHASILSSP